MTPLLARAFGFVLLWLGGTGVGWWVLGALHQSTWYRVSVFRMLWWALWLTVFTVIIFYGAVLLIGGKVP